jgi:hypothetical protein
MPAEQPQPTVGGKVAAATTRLFAIKLPADARLDAGVAIFY